MDWFLYDIGLRHERVKQRKKIVTYHLPIVTNLMKNTLLRGNVLKEKSGFKCLLVEHYEIKKMRLSLLWKISFYGHFLNNKMRFPMHEIYSFYPFEGNNFYVKFEVL